jgi:3-dehydroquinate synthase
MNITSRYFTTVKPEPQTTEYITGMGILSQLHTITLLKRAEFSSFLVITDEKIAHTYEHPVITSLIRFGVPVISTRIPTGEGAKRLKTIETAIAPFFKTSFNRNACLVAIGGGVTTDLGGFISSVLLRGIASIAIPTSLLAQVDASLGGKNGVNTVLAGKLYKNMIGRIDQPRCVISDIDTLKSLPEKEIKNGLGEMVKYWAGWGIPTLEDLEQVKNLKTTASSKIAKVITTCQHIKLHIVKKDPFETKGIRQELNLGHTIGHGIESAANGKLSHGECVAIGLCAVARLSVLTERLSLADYDKIVSAVTHLGLPTQAKGYSIDKIKSAMKMDKKGGTFVMLKGIGKLETGVKVENRLVDKVLKEINL